MSVLRVINLLNGNIHISGANIPANGTYDFLEGSNPDLDQLKAAELKKHISIVDISVIESSGDVFADLELIDENLDDELDDESDDELDDESDESEDADADDANKSQANVVTATTTEENTPVATTNVILGDTFEAPVSLTNAETLVQSGDQGEESKVKSLAGLAALIQATDK